MDVAVLQVTNKSKWFLHMALERTWKQWATSLQILYLEVAWRLPKASAAWELAARNPKPGIAIIILSMFEKLHLEIQSYAIENQNSEDGIPIQTGIGNPRGNA